MIPLVLAAAAGDREAVRVFGTDYPTKDGSCIRDYIHVADLADAHLRAMDYLKNGGESICMNLGNGMGNSVLEVIQAANDITGKKVPVILGERRAGDPPVLIGSAELAKQRLGWQPAYGDIRTILEHAWNWYLHKKY